MGVDGNKAADALVTTEANPSLDQAESLTPAQTLKSCGVTIVEKDYRATQAQTGIQCTTVI